MAAEVRILGLDPSLTSFGVARLRMVRAGVRSFGMVTKLWTPTLRDEARLDWFDRHIEEELYEFQPDLVVVENYAYHKGNRAHQIGELGGVIRLQLHRRHVKDGSRYLVVAPAKLKKFVTGRGNAGKADVIEAIYEQFRYDAETSDEADAGGLAILGAVVYAGLDIPLTDAQLEAVTGIEF